MMISQEDSWKLIKNLIDGQSERRKHAGMAESKSIVAQQKAKKRKENTASSLKRCKTLNHLWTNACIDVSDELKENKLFSECDHFCKFTVLQFYKTDTFLYFEG